MSTTKEKKYQGYTNEATFTVDVLVRNDAVTWTDVNLYIDHYIRTYKKEDAVDQAEAYIDKWLHTLLIPMEPSQRAASQTWLRYQLLAQAINEVNTRELAIEWVDTALERLILNTALQIAHTGMIWEFLVCPCFHTTPQDTLADPMVVGDG